MISSVTWSITHLVLKSEHVLNIAFNNIGLILEINLNSIQCTAMCTQIKKIVLQDKTELEILFTNNVEPRTEREVKSKYLMFIVVVTRPKFDEQVLMKNPCSVDGAGSVLARTKSTTATA